MKFRSRSNLGHVGSKTRSLDQILGKPCVHFLEGTVLSQISLNLARMLIAIKSRSNLKLGHVGSKIRSLCHILEKPCVRSRGHRFDPKVMKLCQNVNSYKI